VGFQSSDQDQDFGSLVSRRGPRPCHEIILSLENFTSSNKYIYYLWKVYFAFTGFHLTQRMHCSMYAMQWVKCKNRHRFCTTIFVLAVTMLASAACIALDHPRRQT